MIRKCRCVWASFKDCEGSCQNWVLQAPMPTHPMFPLQCCQQHWYVVPAMVIFDMRPLGSEFEPLIAFQIAIHLPLMGPYNIQQREVLAPRSRPSSSLPILACNRGLPWVAMAVRMFFTPFLPGTATPQTQQIWKQRLSKDAAARTSKTL